MVSHDLLRYTCQIALPGFREESQELLKQAKILIVGAGGLGCPAAQYLVSTGVGNICIADFDVITLSNLHRQILFNQDEIGWLKAEVACAKLRKQNPDIYIKPFNNKITSENVMNLISDYDIILDGTDNFETKYLLNDACVLAGKPLVHGAIYQYEGQVAVWNVKNIDNSYSPNFRDVFPEVDASQVPNCTEGGVIPTLAGIIGCIQANEIIKLITNSKEVLSGKLLVLNVQSLDLKIIHLGNDTHTEIKGLQKTKEVPNISVRDLRMKIKAEEIQLIDVRSELERDDFNIGGINMPVSNFDYFGVNQLYTKPIVLYCASGKRSYEVAKKIIELYPDLKVYSLDGGLKSWNETINN